MAAFQSPFERPFTPLEPHSHSHPRYVGFESSNASHASSRSSSPSAKARSGELAAEGAPAAAPAAPPPPRLQRQSSLGQQILAQRLEGQLRARQAALGKLKLGGQARPQYASSAGGSSLFGASATAPSSPASAGAGAGALPAACGSHAPRACARAIPEKWVLRVSAFLRLKRRRARS